MRRPFGHPLATRDEGFTLVEVILAMFIVAVVMASLLGVLVSSLSTIAQARQRQTATALATQAIERLRALPYDDVTQATGATWEAGLQWVTTTGTTHVFQPAVLTGVNEQLVVNDWSGHWEDQVVDEVTYRIQTYVSRAPQTAAAEQPFNLTVLVSWTSSVNPNGRTTAQRSVTFSPAGCLSTAQSPFAAPCQAYFTAQAGQALGGISIVNADNSVDPIEGFAGTTLDLTLASNSTSLLVEQTASANAGSQTSGVRSIDTSALTSSDGGASVGSAVDSDPSSGATLPLSGTITQNNGSVSLASTTGSGLLVATPSTSDSGTTAAAIGASTTYCVGTDGTPLVTGPGTDLRPCATSTIRPNGAAGTLTYNPDASLGFGSLVVPMASVGAASGPFRAVSAQLTTTNAGACTNGAGPTIAGCSHGAASRTLGTVTIGSPGTGGTVPAGWDPTYGVWGVTGFSETARAEEGTGARVPSYTRAGTLKIWTGVGYQTVDLAGYAAPPTGLIPASESWAIPPTTVTYVGGSGSVLTVSYEGTVTVQRPQSTLEPATRTGNVITDCKTVACVSTVNSGGGVYGNVTVTVVKDGTQLGRFAIATNLGGLVARSSYKAAPNA